MPDLPESIEETATPDELMRTLEGFREEYQHGLMTASEFKEVLNLFQLTDDGGHLWAPGANTNQWYRWDGHQWTPAAPPSRFKLPPEMVTSSVWERVPQPEPDMVASAPEEEPIPQPQVCSHCGNPVQEGAKFCPECAQKVAIAAPPPATPAEPCCPNPDCGRPVPVGKNFCTNCGSPVAEAAREIPPLTPAERRCPNPQCGRIVAAGKRFCTACGTRVE